MTLKILPTAPLFPEHFTPPPALSSVSATQSQNQDLFIEISKPPRAQETFTTGFGEHFLSVISNWAAAIPIQSFWVMYFEMPKLDSYITKLIKGDYDVGDWNDFSIDMYNHLISKKYNESAQSEYIYGCSFARAISIPGEKTELASTNFTQAGLLFPSVSKNRIQTNTLQASFMETNASFVDTVLRPWSIITSQLGFIPRTPKITSTLHAIFYTKSDILDRSMVGTKTRAGIGRTPRPLNTTLRKRKEFTFYNVVPTSINAQEYTQSGDALLVRPVDFYYTHYNISNIDSLSLII